MTFISYAQNFEDVLLWRALGHVKNGFYIDVGANDPEEHSVTKAFYDAGWSGINIEPLPMYAAAFGEQRPRDVNLAVAAGGAEGSITLYDVESIPGWASPESGVAEMHRKEGHKVSELKVPMRTLTAICAEHARGEVHFLKIDVEGYEAEVLKGMDFQRFRPWIVVVEATLPNSRETNHAAWESMLTSQRYAYAYFDGLNRYYVAAEHKDLAESLTIQPNVFDAFITHHLDKAWADAKGAHEANAKFNERLAKESELRWHAEQRADLQASLTNEALANVREQSRQLGELTAHARQLASQSEQLMAREDALRAALAVAQDGNERLREQAMQMALQNADLSQQLAAAAFTRIELEQNVATLQQGLNEAAWHGQQAVNWARDLEQRIVSIHRSSSWRVTAPLRMAGGLARRTSTSSPRAALRRAAVAVTSSERMRRLLIPVMMRFPGLGRRVTQALSVIKKEEPVLPATSAALAPDIPEMPSEIKALPASARRVVADLQRALRPNNGNQ